MRIQPNVRRSWSALAALAVMVAPGYSQTPAPASAPAWTGYVAAIAAAGAVVFVTLMYALLADLNKLVVEMHQSRDEAPEPVTASSEWRDALALWRSTADGVAKLATRVDAAHTKLDMLLERVPEPAAAPDSAAPEPELEVDPLAPVLAELAAIRAEVARIVSPPAEPQAEAEPAPASEAVEPVRAALAAPPPEQPEVDESDGSASPEDEPEPERHQPDAPAAEAVVPEPAATTTAPAVGNGLALRPADIAAAIVEGEATTAGERELQAFLTALRDQPPKARRVADDKMQDADAVRRVDWQALDRALYERWDAARLSAAGAEIPLPDGVAWVGLAEWIRVQQEFAIASLGQAGLIRIAPSAGSHFEPEWMSWSDEAPVETGDERLQGRVAGVSPGNGGWRLGDRLARPARARAYDYRPEPAPQQR